MSWDPIGTLAEHAIAHAALGVPSLATITAHTSNTSNPHAVTLEQAITAGATATTEPTFNGGIDLGTNGRFDSNVADAVNAYNFLFKPTTTFTGAGGGSNNWIFGVQTSSGGLGLNVRYDGNVGLAGSPGAPEALVAAGSTSLAAAVYAGIIFNPTWGAGAAGFGIGGVTAMFGILAQPRDAATATGGLVAGYLGQASIRKDRAHAEIGGLIVEPVVSWAGTASGATAHGNIFGIRIRPIFTHGAGSSITASTAYGVEISNMLGGANPVTAFCAGIRIAEQTRGTVKYGVYFDSAAGSYKAIAIGSANAYIYYPATDTLGLAGTQIRVVGDLFHTGTQLGVFNTTPAAQSTGWSVSNVTSDKTFDANSTTVDELADVLGTLIDTLKTYGLLGA